MQQLTITRSQDGEWVNLRVANVKVISDVNIFYPLVFVIFRGKLNEVFYRPIPSQKQTLWTPHEADDLTLDALYALLSEDALRTLIGELNGY